MKANAPGDSPFRMLPMPESRERISWQRTFTHEEYERIRSGHHSAELNNRWYVHTENNWVHFVRSWTRYCIFKVKLEAGENTVRAAEVWVNRDPSQYNNIDLAYDLDTLEGLIGHLLKGSAAFPSTPTRRIHKVRRPAETYNEESASDDHVRT
jgi:hypothetical protein